MNATPGPWKIRTRKVGGKIVDCFVAAPSFSGLAYGSEILGEDEYREENGALRRLADCQKIISADLLLRTLERINAIVSPGESDPERMAQMLTEIANMVPQALAKAKGQS